MYYSLSIYICIWWPLDVMGISASYNTDLHMILTEQQETGLERGSEDHLVFLSAVVQDQLCHTWHSFSILALRAFSDGYDLVSIKKKGFSTKLELKYYIKKSARDNTVFFSPFVYALQWQSSVHRFFAWFADCRQQTFQKQEDWIKTGFGWYWLQWYKISLA